MRRTQVIDLVTTIKSTRVSFFSIFLFVTLGLGVFLGIHWLAGSLHAMANQALSAGHAHDIEIIYPYGLTEEDLKQLGSLEGVDEVEAGYLTYEQTDLGDDILTLKFHTIPDAIDTFVTTEGELPSRVSEVALERTWAEQRGLRIGDTLDLVEHATGEDPSGLVRRTFEVTALVVSPSYLGTDSATYGASTLGDGGVDGVCWVTKDAFDPEQFHNAKPYVTLRSHDLSDLSSFDESYRERAQQLDDRVSELGTSLAAKRYDDLHAEATDALDEGQKAFDDAERALEQARAELEESQASYDEACASAEQMPEPQRTILLQQLEGQAEELDDAQKQIDDGEAELEKKRVKLEDARAKVNALTESVWTILQRRYNAGLSLLESYAGVTGRLRWSMASLFFLVGLFVCYSAVSRIVYEQTVQIGTKKALGFKGREVTRMYMAYSTAAVAIGVLLAIPVSLFAVELVILRTLNTYFVCPASLHFVLGDLILLALLELILILLSTRLATHSVLARHAVELLAGAEPPVIKKRFFEDWSVWRRMGLLAKVTVNNCINDSRRVLATVIGVAGCTALVVTAVTLNNCVLNSLTYQYGDLYHYDTVVYIDPGDDVSDAMGLALEDAGVPSTPVLRSSHTLRLPDGAISTARVTVPQDVDSYGNDFHTLRITEGNFDEHGVIVSQAYAEHMGARVGDTIELTDTEGEAHQFDIAGFFEHHLQGFEIIMSPILYEEAFDEAMVPNCLFVRSENAGIAQVQEAVQGVGGYRACVNERGRQEQIFENFSNLTTIVVLVYLALAFVMAFVVLLNLNVMFISEKRRELIVLMVCGFTSREAKGYIWHDSVVLTVLGILCGVALGVVTGGMSVVSVETNDIVCMRGVSWLAVGMGVLTSAILSALVLIYALRAIPRFKLSDINSM